MSPKTLVDQFIDGLSASASKALSEKPPAWIVSLDATIDKFPPGTQMLTLLLTAEPSKAEAAIQISLESALVLGGSLTGGTSPVPAQLKPEHAQAVRNAFAKACETAAQALQLQVQLQPAKSVAWVPAKLVSFSGSNGGTGRIQFQVLFSAEWQKLGPAAAVAAARPPAIKGVNVGMLEAVELDVTLRFGQRQLSLREIGELRSGSVLELKQLVQDPVELLLAESVIARGEVVVVNGNYALRVTEVVQPNLS